MVRRQETLTPAVTSAAGQFLLDRSYAFGQLYDQFVADHGLTGIEDEQWPARAQAQFAAAHKALTTVWRAKAAAFERDHPQG